AALAPDGRTMALVHSGRLGLLNLGNHNERAVVLPEEPGAQIAQPPYWISPDLLVLSLVARPAGHKVYGIWIFDGRHDRFTRIADGFLRSWMHTPQEIATSSGLLKVEY